jgi:hypothetical protein
MPDWSRCDLCKRPLGEADAVEILPNNAIACENCRRSAVRPSDALQRGLYRSAMRLAPADFAAEAKSRSEAVKDLSVNLKRIIAQSIGNTSIAERPGLMSANIK